MVNMLNSGSVNFKLFFFHVGHFFVDKEAKEQRNILHEIRKRKANWIGHILRRNCLLQRVIKGKIQGWIEVTGRQGRRRRKVLDDLKERREYSHLKEEALDRTMWRARFGRGFGPVIRQTTKWMKAISLSIRNIVPCIYQQQIPYIIHKGLVTTAWYVRRLRMRVTACRTEG